MVASSRSGLLAWAIGWPVVRSTLPSDRSRSLTLATGKLPPSPGGVGVVLTLFGKAEGKRFQLVPSS